jgi:plastocyanin
MIAWLPAVLVAGRVLSGGEPSRKTAILLDGGKPAAPVEAKLDEVWLSFAPKVQVVAPGSTIILADRDEESHTVHAWYGLKTVFNRAVVPHEPGQRFTVDRPGVMTVTCDLHREMRGFVVVSASSYAAVSDVDGRFRLEVAPGRYRVRAWRWDGGDPDGPPVGRDAGELTVADSPAELDLELPAPTPVPSAAAAPIAPAPPRAPPTRLPSWMMRARRPWPTGAWGWVFSVAGVPIGFALAIANLRLAARRGRSGALAVLGGCALAFLLGATVVFGLNGAVAIALGFGAFIGTVIFGAS